MPNYFIRHTDTNKPPIEVQEGGVDESSLDIALFGRIKLEYGERLNQNILNVLENFAVGMDPNLVPVTPTPMPSFSNTPPPSNTPTPSVTPSTGASSTPTPTPSPTPSVTPSSGVSPTPTPSPTATPSISVTPSVTPSEGAPPSATPTPEPSATPTPEPSVTPTPSVSMTVTPTVTPTTSITPTTAETSTPTPTPTVTPTVTPTQSPFPPMSLDISSTMDAAEFYLFTIPCDEPAQTTPGLSASGTVVVNGGSGSFTYLWSHVPDGASAFAVDFSSVGDTFFVDDDEAIRTCPYEAVAFGTVSVTVTDTVTGLSEIYGGTYSLEYSG